MNVTFDVITTIKKNYENLTATDKRIADLLHSNPERVAFGTVLTVAEAAKTSGPSIVRFAEKIGYSGFVGLQNAVREDLSLHLSSSDKRIETDSQENPILRTRQIELHNVENTLNKVDSNQLEKFIDLLNDDDRAIYLLASDQCYGSAFTFFDLLSIVRDRVRWLKGSPYRISNLIQGTKRKDVLLCMDFERHENWVIDAVKLAAEKKLQIVSITNNPLSSIATQSKLNFFASATAPGTFDSNTGLNALLNLFISALSQRRKSQLAKRLKQIHSGWLQHAVIEST